MRTKECIGLIAAAVVLILASGAGATSVSDTVWVSGTTDVVFNMTIANPTVSWPHANPYSGDYEAAVALGLVSSASLTIYTPRWGNTNDFIGVTFTDADGTDHDLGVLTKSAASTLFDLHQLAWLDTVHVTGAVKLKGTGSNKADLDISTSVLTVNYSRLYLMPTANADGSYAYNYTEGNPIVPLSLDASGSTRDPLTALTYMWDLDNNGSYETSAGSAGIFSLLNPVATFGTTSGQKTIGLQVFDGYNYATATSTLNYEYTPDEPEPEPAPEVIPEPLTGFAVVMGIMSLGGYIRRRAFA